jgi:hypothetical protein
LKPVTSAPSPRSRSISASLTVARTSMTTRLSVVIGSVTRSVVTPAAMARPAAMRRAVEQLRIDLPLHRRPRPLLGGERVDLRRRLRRHPRRLRGAVGRGRARLGREIRWCESAEQQEGRRRRTLARHGRAGTHLLQTSTSFSLGRRTAVIGVADER